MQKTFANTSLKLRNSPRTVLLLMAENLERADRIKDLKKKRPALKWRLVAEAAGVKERTVVGWAQKGALSYEHAEVLAEVAEVDLDWLWRGPAQESPDLMSALAQPEVRDQLDQIEALLRENHQMMRDLLAFATERALDDVPPPKAKPGDESERDAGG